jgi:hypothetical protein
MKYDTIISIGANCRVAQALRDVNLRKESFPLDWTLNSAQAVLALLKMILITFFHHQTAKTMSLEVKGERLPLGIKHTIPNWSYA